jgi:hypothetical protein
LSERLSSSSSGAPKANFGIAQKALRDAVSTEEPGTGGLNIKGASSVKEGNVVQVSGLVKGTTAADVEVSCSPSSLSSRDATADNEHLGNFQALRTNPLLKTSFFTFERQCNYPNNIQTTGFSYDSSSKVPWSTSRWTDAQCDYCWWRRR